MGAKMKMKMTERMQSTRTGNHAKSRIKRKRKLAGLLAMALLLSNVPVMQLTAAPDYTMESDTAHKAASNMEDAGEGSENGQDTGAAGEGSGIGSGTGNTGEGREPGSDTGNADEGSETGSDAGNLGEGSETGSDTGNAGEGNESDPDAGNKGEDNENEENTADPEEDAESDENADDTEEGEELPGTGKNDKKAAGVIESLSEEELAAQREWVPDILPEMEVLEMPEHYDASQDIYRQSFYAADDAAYDSRDEGILAPIRNQNPWGTCWAFATLGTMEISLVMQGLADKDTVDLAERHLAYFTYHTGDDVLGNATGDTVNLTGGLPYLDRGGNMSRASLRLMNWQGAAAEADYPYSNEGTMEDLSVESAQDNAYHMRDCFFLDTKANDPETIQNVKALVRQYGGVFWSYRDEKDYYNSDTYAYYNYEQNNTNHAIMIVGWDDDFPKENFKKEPENNGAWIVRNSWSERWGDAGYFYISYEDVSLGAGNPAAVAVAGAGDNYDNNYFNSNTVAWNWRYGMKMAQVYSLKGLSSDREAVRAVSFMTGSTNRDYTIQIYKNPEMTNGVVTDPESGTAMLETELAGRISYAGIYTVDLPEPVICNADDKIAVVIYFSDNGYGYIYKDLSEENNSSNIRNHNVTHAGESFYSRTLAGSWVDMHEDGESLRINLLTDNMEGEAAIVVKASAASPKHMNDTYKVDLRWNKIFGASEYEIYRAETIDGTYEKIGVSDASERQYQDAIEQADYAEHYYYKGRAVFPDGSDRCSDPVEAGLTAEIVFDHFALAGVGAVVTLSWDTVTGAAGYEIERKEKKDDSYRMLTRIEDASCVEYTDDLSEQEPGIYQYRIRAYSAEGKYTEWAQQEFTMDLKITQIDYQTLQFSWPPIEGAYWYYVYIGVGDKFYGLGYRSAENVSRYYNISDMLTKRNLGTYQVGDDYTYYVRILDSNNSEIYRTTRVSFHTVPDALEIEAIERSETAEDTPAVKLTWSGGGGADTVAVYRSEDPENKGEVYATAPAEDGTYTDAAVENGRTYYYWLCPTVLNSAGQTVEGEMTAYSRIMVVEIVYKTEMKSAQAVSDTEVLLTWEENADADGYFLYRKEIDDTSVSMIAILEKGVTSYKDT
ncbi:MAG: hypothetical protein K2N77_12925, partial [Lachnospiraceae bacterium]|nr:hypothetical protein [Lachnospiraceae bacterium]